MHEALNEVSKCTGVKKAGQKVAGFGKWAWRNEERQSFFCERDELVLAHERRSELRERLMEVRQVDAAQAFRMCVERRERRAFRRSLTRRGIQSKSPGGVKANMFSLAGF